MSPKLLLMTVFSLLVLNSPAFADNTKPVNLAAPVFQQSDITELKRQADAWGLKTEEWQRYQELMDGPLGIYSPGLDPLTALGIEARNDEERRYYAELQVQAESRRVEKELAYQLAYDEAWKRLYPALLPLSDTMDTTTVLSSDGRLALFVKDNCPACDVQAKRLESSGQSFDIYFVDSNNNDTLIRRWATRINIDPQKVLSRAITLNHDSGKWEAIGIASDLPAAVKEVNGRWVLQ